MRRAASLLQPVPVAPLPVGPAAGSRRHLQFVSPACPMPPLTRQAPSDASGRPGTRDRRCARERRRARGRRVEPRAAGTVVRVDGGAGAARARADAVRRALGPAGRQRSRADRHRRWRSRRSRSPARRRCRWSARWWRRRPGPPRRRPGPCPPGSLSGFAARGRRGADAHHRRRAAARHHRRRSADAAGRRPRRSTSATTSCSSRRASR